LNRPAYVLGQDGRARHVPHRGGNQIAPGLLTGSGQSVQLVAQSPQLQGVRTTDRAEQHSFGGLIVQVFRVQYGMQGG